MSLDWEQVVVDAHDPAALGAWWRRALDWEVVNDDPEEFEIRLTADRLPGLLFVRDWDSERSAAVRRGGGSLFASAHAMDRCALQVPLGADDDDVLRPSSKMIGVGRARQPLGSREREWIGLASDADCTTGWR